MKTVAIVQARMKSDPLPGRPLIEIAGQPLLGHVINRLHRAQRIDTVVVATSSAAEDDPIEALCGHRGWKCFRTPGTDVLDRFYRAAEKNGAGQVIRVHGDCPLIDPTHVDAVVNRLDAVPDADIATNGFPRTYPRGLEVEAIRFSALEAAWRDDSDPSSRERPTSFLFRHPERFRVVNIAHTTDLSSHRWLVETSEDLALLSRVFAQFPHASFSWREALQVLEASSHDGDPSTHISSTKSVYL